MNESVVNTPQQAAALGIVNQLNDNDKVAVVEFKGNASIIEHVKKLSEGRKEIKEKIQNLQFGLGTILNQALDKAYWALQEYSLSGDKYVIIISDGVYSGRDFNQSLQEIHSLVAKNITFYTVGVGPYTEEQTLLGLAKAGKGRYYKPDDYGGLIAEIDK